MNERKKKSSSRKKSKEAPKRFKITVEGGLEFLISADTADNATLQLVDQIIKAKVDEVKPN